MNEHEILNEILDIGIQISAQHDYHELLPIIVDRSMYLSHCDAATLYLLKDGRLHFMVMRNKTFNESQTGGITLPPVSLMTENVCSYCAITKTVLNVGDVYNDPKFVWDGPRKYDKMTGYHTQSMCVIPLMNSDDDVIGVLQLINAQDETGKVIPFSAYLEHIITSLASQVAMILSNMILTQEIQDVLDSFVDSFVTALDSRTPYNANHSRNVANLCKGFLTYLKENGREDITDNTVRQLHMAAMVHDVGKMIIPLDVLDKATRLEKVRSGLDARKKYISLYVENKYLKNEFSVAEYEQWKKELAGFDELINTVDTAPFLSDEVLAETDRYKGMEIDGIPFITDEEYPHFMIRKGTLTADERHTIENHAVYSENILSKIKFGKKYADVYGHAIRHHEYINGSGYPNGLTAEELPFESRVLTVMDIYESLSSVDRPYKKSIPIPKCYNILTEMVGEGKLDSEIVNDFGEYLKSLGLI